MLDFAVGAPVSLVLNPPTDLPQAILYATSLSGLRGAMSASEL